MIGQLLAWFTDAANWSGPNGIPVRLAQHLVMSFVAMVIAIAIAVPLGVWLGHSAHKPGLILNLGSVGRAIPTFAVLVILASWAPVGVGDLAAIIALALFAIPPILVASYDGIRSADADVVDAARGMGFTGGQILRQVELPYATPHLASGIRSATVQVVATASLAALVGGGGLGRYVVDGFARQDAVLIIAGALLTALLAVVTDLVLRRGQVLATLPALRVREASQAVGIGVGLLIVFGLMVAPSALASMRGPSSGASLDGPVVIAAYSFGESKIMAELYAQALEAKGIDAQVQELSSREVVEPALEDGDVGMVPEYLGTVTEFLNKKVNGPDAAAVASGDVTATSQALAALATPRGLTAFTPSPAADQNAFAVTAAFAQAHGLKTVSDLAAYSQQNPLVLGGPPECPTRPFCQPGLVSVYGMKLAQFVPLDAGGPLTKQSLAQGKTDVGLVFSSDGGLGEQGLVVLDDDKHLQTVDNLVPLVNAGIATPKVREVLDAVSAALTTDLLVSLNKQVDIDRKDPAEVARQFLADHGFL